MAKTSHGGLLLRAIALFKFVKAALLIAAGIGALHLVNKDINEYVDQVVVRYHLDPGNHFVAQALARTANVTPRRLHEIGAVAGLTWDSADLEAAPAMVARVTEEVGPVDILVTNTGGPPADPDPLALTAAQWEHAHRTLVLAPMTLLRLVLPGMRQRRWGRVVGVASTSVREPIPALVLSNAERSAQLAAYKTLAREVAGDGVTINTLLTGWIATERARKSVFPTAFWFFSIGGGLLSFCYALTIRDPVFILGQGAGVFIYARNLYFVRRSARDGIPARN